MKLFEEINNYNNYSQEMPKLLFENKNNLK